MSAPRAPDPTACPEQLLDAGLARHRAGDLAGAARCYQLALQRAPDHARGWHLLGLTHAQAGDAADAMALFTRALMIDAHYAEAHCDMGDLHRQLGQNAQAATSYRAAIAADATLAKEWGAKAWGNLGATLRDLGDGAGAIAACRQALAIDPGRIETQYNLGCALHHNGHLANAVAAYRTVLTRQPRHGDVQGQLGLALMQSGRVHEALGALQAQVRITPGAAAQIALSACLTALGRFGAALEAAEAATRLAPGSAPAWLQLGHALRELGRTARAVNAYTRALQIHPQSTECLVALAVAAQERGAGKDAARYAGQALAIDPQHAMAWTVRAGLKRYTPGDADLTALTTLADTVTDPTDRTHIEFALAKALMDCDLADAALSRLDRANRRHRAGVIYDSDADLAGMAALADAFDDVHGTGPSARTTSHLPAYPAAHPAAYPAAHPATMRPIFIVGMPGSGTVPVEQILAAHPAIHGGRTRQHLDHVLMDHFGGPADPVASAWRLAGLGGPNLGKLARAYHQRATADAPQGLRVTDAMPSNFRHLGLIVRMFPGALIVHCRSDPRDTCLSIYATYFAQNHDFAYDPGELGAYYRAYQRLMVHWRAVLPAGAMIEIDYEAVVGDPAGQAQWLVAACGLEWDQACLRFDPIATNTWNAAAGYDGALPELGLGLGLGLEF
jgi:tetratricopeptide (TPR) repeat protein